MPSQAAVSSDCREDDCTSGLKYVADYIGSPGLVAPLFRCEGCGEYVIRGDVRWQR